MNIKKEEREMDSLIAGATAALYGLENQKIVEEHFDEFINDMLQHFDNPEFQERILGLKTRGRITGGIVLPKRNDLLCFANKIWYMIYRSTSAYPVWYWLKIGINLRHDEFNPMDLSKVYINRICGGDLEHIITKIHNKELAEDVKKRLAEGIYDCCYNSAMKVFDDTGK